MKNEVDSFPAFQGWQKGYAAFTYADRMRQRLIHYAHNQEEHHRNMSSKLELRLLLEYYGIEFDERYFE